MKIVLHPCGYSEIMVEDRSPTDPADSLVIMRQDSDTFYVPRHALPALIKLLEAFK